MLKVSWIVQWDSWMVSKGYVVNCCSNLTLPMKLIFCSPITTCNNLLLIIYNENIVDIIFLLWKMLKHFVVITIFSQLLRCQFFTSQSKI